MHSHLKAFNVFKMHSGSSLHSFINPPLRLCTSAHNQPLISSFSQPNTLLYAQHTLFSLQALPPYLIWPRPCRREESSKCCLAAASSTKFSWSFQVARRTWSVPLLQPWHLLRALLLSGELWNKCKCLPYSLVTFRPSVFLSSLSTAQTSLIIYVTALVPDT